jgi:hypothetical protein
MESCIYRTDLNWFSFVKNLPSGQTLNFWRKPRGMRIQNGAFVYFMPRETIYIAGRAIVLSIETRKIDIAWETWRQGNGAASLNQFRAMVVDREIPNENDEIGCLLLINPQFINAKPIIPDSLNPTARQSIRYFTHATWPEISSYF